jgi:hypothetical protein
MTQSYSTREVVRLVRDMAEQYGGQSVLARALGLNATAVSRAATGVAVTPIVTAAIGLAFDETKGRYVRVREPSFASGSEHASMAVEVADATAKLRAANARIASLLAENDRLRRKLNGSARSAA